MIFEIISSECLGKKRMKIESNVEVDSGLKFPKVIEATMQQSYKGIFMFTQCKQENWKVEWVPIPIKSSSN